MENNQEETTNNNEETNSEEKSNLLNIPIDQSTIYYFNTAKDNYHSKHFSPNDGRPMVTAL